MKAETKRERKRGLGLGLMCISELIMKGAALRRRPKVQRGVGVSLALFEI